MTRAAVGWRIPLLAASGVALVAGLYSTLLLLGFALPVPRPALAEVHGPVLAGLLWAGAGRVVAGPGYDAVVHAVFLGFTMSMIFVHAPVILPAVLRRPLPYRAVLYGPLVLLHVSLLVRVALGDGAGWEPLWRWAAAGNIVVVLGFAGSAAVLAVRSSTPTVHGTRSTVDAHLAAGARR